MCEACKHLEHGEYRCKVKVQWQDHAEEFPPFTLECWCENGSGPRVINMVTGKEYEDLPWKRVW